MNIVFERENASYTSVSFVSDWVSNVIALGYELKSSFPSVLMTILFKELALLREIKKSNYEWIKIDRKYRDLSLMHWINPSIASGWEVRSWDPKHLAAHSLIKLIICREVMNIFFKKAYKI